MKIGIMICFSKLYDIPMDEVVDLFQSNDVLEYLDEGSEMFIIHMYPYMADLVAEYLGMPVIDR